MANMLTSPKILALDTSHWANLINAAYSANESLRLEAWNFSEMLLKKGYCILLTWHHLQELMAIEDEKLITFRLAFIREMPLIS